MHGFMICRTIRSPYDVYPADVANKGEVSACGPAPERRNVTIQGRFTGSYLAPLSVLKTFTVSGTPGKIGRCCHARTKCTKLLINHGLEVDPVGCCMQQRRLTIMHAMLPACRAVNACGMQGWLAACPANGQQAGHL